MGELLDLQLLGLEFFLTARKKRLSGENLGIALDKLRASSYTSSLAPVGMMSSEPFMFDAKRDESST